MNTKRSTILAGFLILIIAAAFPICRLQYANQQLSGQVLAMQKTVDELRQVTATTSFEADCRNLNVLYVSFEDKYKIVMDNVDLQWLPLASSPVVGPIRQYTIVSINDAVSVDNHLWLNVTVPVYDSPMNMKGWILESKTAAVTDENRKLITNGLIVKAGAMVYETEKFLDITKATPTPLPCDQVASVEERQQGYLKLNIPGGNMIWLKESDVTFPDLEK
jgi:hypothetical protein